MDKTEQDDRDPGAEVRTIDAVGADVCAKRIRLHKCRLDQRLNLVGVEVAPIFRPRCPKRGSDRVADVVLPALKLSYRPCMSRDVDEVVQRDVTD